MSSTPERLHAGLSDLLDLYKETKKLVKIFETKNKEHLVPVASMNEMRNCLDHIMRAIEKPDTLDYEIKEVKEHLQRAFYDCFEILSMDMCREIASVVGKYSTSVISNVFPEYYTEIQPKLRALQTQISGSLVDKHIDPQAPVKTLDSYKELLGNIYQMQLAVDQQTVALEKGKDRSFRRFWLEHGLSFIIGVAASTLCFWICKWCGW